MIEGTDMEGLDSEAILMKAHQTNNVPLFNNAAQVLAFASHAANLIATSSTMFLSPIILKYQRSLSVFFAGLLSSTGINCSIRELFHAVLSPSSLQSHAKITLVLNLEVIYTVEINMDTMIQNQNIFQPRCTSVN